MQQFTIPGYFFGHEKSTQILVQIFKVKYSIHNNFAVNFVKGPVGKVGSFQPGCLLFVFPNNCKGKISKRRRILKLLGSPVVKRDQTVKGITLKTKLVICVPNFFSANLLHILCVKMAAFNYTPRLVPGMPHLWIAGFNGVFPHGSKKVSKVFYIYLLQGFLIVLFGDSQFFAIACGAELVLFTTHTSQSYFHTAASCFSGF
nr:hypothetical protein [Desulfonatronospira thiodismutans]